MFGKNKGKSIDAMTTEEIEKYLESRKAEERKDHTLQDSADESAPTDGKDVGTEDGQTASDRDGEAPGDEEGKDADEEAEGEEADTTAAEEPDADDPQAPPQAAAPAEQGSSTTPDDDWRSRVEQKLDALKADLDGLKRTPQPADEMTSDRLTALEKKFN